MCCLANLVGTGKVLASFLIARPRDASEHENDEVSLKDWIMTSLAPPIMLRALVEHYRDDRALVAILLCMSNMTDHSRSAWCSLSSEEGEIYDELPTLLTATLDHFPNVVELQRYDQHTEK